MKMLDFRLRENDSKIDFISNIYFTVMPVQGSVEKGYYHLRPKQKQVRVGANCIRP
jgi:hypothetical protein